MPSSKQTAKILILGRSGQLAWELRHKLACLGNVVSAARPEVDFEKPQSLRDIVASMKPSVIVNAAAWTAVDKAESSPEAAYSLNATAPAVLAEEAKRRGSLLVHYSTDYVYDGSKAGAWVETDSTNPLNVYGKSKLKGDQAIEASGTDHLIFRTSWVYGARGSNFLLTMLRLAKERPELRIVDDQTGSPTSSECIAQATADVLSQMLGPRGVGLDGRGGVYHLSCVGSTTWFGFAKAILERGSNCPKLMPIPSSEYPVPAKRPVNSVLSCEKLAENFGVRLPHWQTALELVMETIGDS